MSRLRTVGILARRRTSPCSSMAALRSSQLIIPSLSLSNVWNVSLAQAGAVVKPASGIRGWAVALSGGCAPHRHSYNIRGWYSAWLPLGSGVYPKAACVPREAENKTTSNEPSAGFGGPLTSGPSSLESVQAPIVNFEKRLI